MTILRPSTCSQFLPGRRGMTLVELLVVVSVIVIVMAIMVPALQPVVKGRKVREAARQINAVCVAAKVRAAEYNRPVGIWIQSTINGDNVRTGVATEICMAEVAMPYSGDTYNSRAMPVNGSPYTFQLTNCPVGLAGSDPLIQVGDLICFNAQSPFYTVSSISGDQITVTDRQSQSSEPTPPRVDPDAGAIFQVYRAPTKAGFKPSLLPRGAVIDMGWSGLGDNAWGQLSSWAAINNEPMILLFSPNGRVDRISLAGTEQRVSETIYILVGEAGQNNLNNGSARWIAINAANGHVTTHENVSHNAVGPVTTAVEARTIARKKIAEGGQ